MGQQGQILAELKRQFHGLRGPYLKWATRRGVDPDVALGHFRRALIGWYEARIDPEDPYLWEVDEYVKAVAGSYLRGDLLETAALAELSPLDTAAPGEQNPLDYLPRPVQLDGTQTVMLEQFQQQGKTCRELLLMVDYHHLSYRRVAEVLGLEGMPEEVVSRRHKCLLMIREGWQLSGILPVEEIPRPVDEELLDRYFAGELDQTERWGLEARLPGDPVFRRALTLRESWNDVLRVAGRQDLMQTLVAEESTYASTSPLAPASAPDVKLSPRNNTTTLLGKYRIPNLQTILAVALLGVFVYLAWTTFGAAAPQARAVEYFEPYPNLFATRPPSNDYERDLQRILYYYDRGDYRTAYDELLPVAPAYPAAELYLGVSALAMEQPGRALDWFAQIPDNDAYHDPAEWYEALAFLALSRRPAALARLSRIAENPRHPYQRRALDLIEELT